MLFAMSGVIDNKHIVVTWNNGTIRPAAFHKRVKQEIERRSKEFDYNGWTITDFMQECKVSLKDPLFCHQVLTPMFDEVQEVFGLLELEPEPEPEPNL